MSPRFVASLPNVWRVATLARELRVRPSELLGVDDSYVAFCLDEAIMTGRTLIQGEVDKVTHKNEKVQARRREDKLRQILGLTSTKGRFRNPPSI